MVTVRSCRRQRLPEKKHLLSTMVCYISTSLVNEFTIGVILSPAALQVNGSNILSDLIMPTCHATACLLACFNGSFNVNHCRYHYHLVKVTIVITEIIEYVFS